MIKLFRFQYREDYIKFINKMKSSDLLIEDLELLEYALLEYKASKYIPRESTDRGLCLYFMNQFNIVSLKYQLPTLYKQKPWYKNECTYWWKLGRLNPRIRALKRSIKLYKKTYKIN